LRLSGVHLHWTTARVPPGVGTVEEALRTASGCLDFRALADSLADRRILTPEGLVAVLGASDRGRRAPRAHHPAAESGIETLVRLALRRLLEVVRRRDHLWRAVHRT
jgi:hypothetical protein